MAPTYAPIAAVPRPFAIAGRITEAAASPVATVAATPIPIPTTPITTLAALLC